MSRADLGAMERHGKREDVMGKARRVSEVPPLVYGSLDLVRARDEWMEGVQQQGKTEAIHMLVQFPTFISVKNPRRQESFLKLAVKFANKYHGGDAVFAARIDRDEQGQHTVDVFLMPRHDFTYKDGRTVKRAAVSKFSKAQAKVRFGKEDPRSQGSALQDAWYEFLRDDLSYGEQVLPPQRKKTRTKDRLEPEEYALKQESARLSAEAQQRLQDISMRERELAKREAEIEKAAVVLETAQSRAGQNVDPDLSRLADRSRQKRRATARSDRDDH
ncbi:hypothetical protein ACQCQA_25365 [Ralstonia pseudosolanacearum]|uniref:hypothetical protein n=3 Tax=Ralstonia pseudosolanacearum TaxID=1310165 RepID=UPI003CED572C